MNQVINYVPAGIVAPDPIAPGLTDTYACFQLLGRDPLYNDCASAASFLRRGVASETWYTRDRRQKYQMPFSLTYGEGNASKMLTNEERMCWHCSPRWLPALRWSSRAIKACYSNCSSRWYSWNGRVAPRSMREQRLRWLCDFWACTYARLRRCLPIQIALTYHF